MNNPDAPNELEQDENELNNVEKSSYDDFDELYVWDTETSSYIRINNDASNNIERKDISSANVYEDIEPNEEVTSLTTAREQRILSFQNGFKKTIKVSLKSFLISISLTFLSFFV